MKTTISISISVAKHNKGFTIGLTILFIILTTVIIMERYTISSVRRTIEDYSEEYHSPDMWAVTEVLPESTKKLLPDYPEIVNREYSMTMNVRCRVNKKQVFVLSLTSIEKDGFRKYYISEKKQSKENMPQVMVSAYYAMTNEINAGDVVELMTDEGYQEFFVSGIVSCPENMFCSRNVNSWCDSSDFGYLYLSRDVMDEYYPVSGCVNLWSFRVADNCSGEREEEILNDIADVFGSNLISAERFAASNIKTQLDNELIQAEDAVQYMPYFAYILGLFFACLFIQQVMNDQKKTIGLLRALGYTSRKVLKVFMIYTVLTGLIGMILGAGLGAVLTKFIVDMFKETYSLPYIHYYTNIPLLVFLLVIPLIIGVVSCVIRAGIITKINPADAFGGAAPAGYTDLPRCLKKLRLSEMVKIAVVSVYRNRRRFLLSAVCIAATIIISLTSIALSISNNAALSAAFGNEDSKGGRFRYDVLICNSGGDGFTELVKETEGVAKAEPVIVFRNNICFGDKKLETQINGICKGSTLIVPENADGSIIQPEDGIILEETAARKLGVKIGDKVKIGDTELKVTEIAREIVNSIQYVSFDTAEKLGYNVQNEIAVSFTDEADSYDVCADLTELPGFDYTVTSEHQEISVIHGCRAKDTAVYISSALAFLLGLIIVFNMVALTVEEKKLDYATLIALGTPVRGFLSMAFTENIMRYLVAIVPGIPAGCLTAVLVMNGMSSLKTSYPFMHVEMVCIVVILLSQVYLFGGVLFSLWKVKHVEPSEALNERE